MEPDLTSSITMHPRPFELSRSSTPRSTSNARAMLPLQQDATSSGVETMNDSTAHDAIARHVSADVESQVTEGGNGRLPRFSVESDPYNLSGAYKSATELEQIRANTSRKRDAKSGSTLVGGSGSSPTTSSGVRSTSAVAPGGKTGKGGGSGPFSALRSALTTRRLRRFYSRQNEMIERLLKTVEEHREQARQEQGDDQIKYRIAVWGSFAANILLAFLQAYAAISSVSLSLFTTMADSIFDPLSNVTLIVTNRAVRRVDPSRFPSGKARLETIGNIVFCFLMTALSFILIAFSIFQLIARSGSSDTNKFHLPSVVAVCVAFATKLGLFLYCFALRDRYSQIRILWQDHRNDLLINGFGILTSVGGAKLQWWIDPAGAILLSIIISCIWLRTAFTEFLLLVGVVASVDAQQLITYVCVTHSDAIRQIDTVRVYHSGPRLIAEIDVVMDPAASLAATHDVAEALQFKLESLPDVERAYVHVDYETTHKPEHAYKKDL
ncbi:Metal tolerance protein 3 [Pleurostoma richardsiae]|uniref:Metal tolerance protein 3 n=1 Tax=Pleurostoma richardsiae TaxID=41990 RepID=A0AA38VDS4_9PEZI|nr:Metal tolerance protein 3 [Pleurostoma richardsiae]